ncbi:invasion associated locus B family protein [Actibacterium ureilyticum]|uniref:invasion associated locus B family protein n=1 Tax=Actibacterium ureilyticum TaxID=1590614 RepID=UPI000BAAF5B2|nr:invasion associated locus B family protein [Actibacterium ureilyticum]
MTRWMKYAVASAILATAPVAANAQETENRVAVKTDWSVYVEDNPTECWAVSAPRETVNTDADGNIKAVRRGDIYMLVFYRPSESITGQIQFAGGYPFAPGSTVSVQIGDSKFDLFTEGESAWPATAAEDGKIIAAMKRGADAVVTGRSARGTVTKDTFSLLGFTAAVDEAQSRCAN